MQRLFFRPAILAVLLPLLSFSQSPYSLQKALQTARINNLILKREHYTLDVGQANIMTAKLRPNPTLNNQSLQLVNSKFDFENSRWDNRHNRQVWWQMTKTFQLPAQRRNKIDLAEMNYEFLNRNYRELERNLFYDVAMAWLDVWATENKLNQIRRTKTLVDSISTNSEMKQKNQSTTETDLIRMQLWAIQYEVQVKSMEQELSNEQNDLRLALATSDSIVVDRADSFISHELVNYDTLLVHALSNRSDIQSAKAAINASAANIKLQKSMAFPQPQLGVIWNPQNTIPYLGFFGTIDIPLFSRNQGEIQKSTILKRQAEQSITALTSQIETEVRSAYNTYVTQQEIAAKYTKIIEQSGKILDKVRHAYLNGDDQTLGDYLDAQRDSFDIQQQYFDAQLEYRQSYVTLLYVSGMIRELAD